MDSAQQGAVAVEVETAVSDGTATKRRESGGSNDESDDVTMRTETTADVATVRLVMTVNATANRGVMDSESEAVPEIDTNSTISAAASRVQHGANFSSEGHPKLSVNSSTHHTMIDTQASEGAPPLGGAHVSPELATDLSEDLASLNVTAAHAPAVESVEPAANAETVSRETSIPSATSKSSAPRDQPAMPHELPGLRHKTVLDEGSGDDYPSDGDVVRITYVGRLLNGTQFDASADHGLYFQFRVGAASRALRGWDAAVRTMRRGERALVRIAPEYAYGEAGLAPLVDANTEVDFEMSLVSFESGRGAGMPCSGSDAVLRLSAAATACGCACRAAPMWHACVSSRPFRVSPRVFSPALVYSRTPI
jgi:FKBP-type peptidyl-prolyl cis-trans isomerase